MARLASLVITVGWMAGCAKPAPPSGPSEIELSGVGAWHQAGEHLEARVTAGAARLDPEGRSAVLDVVSLHLPDQDMTVDAPRMQVDLVGRRARGEDGAVVHGEAFELTGRAFDLDLDAERLTLSGPVEGTGEVSR